MAKKKASSTKNKKSKTELIREALRKTKNGSPSLVAKKLNAQGVKVTPQYVSTIKAADKRKSQAGEARRGPGRPVGSGTKTSVPAEWSELKQCSELMLKAVELVLQAGPKQAQQLVTVAADMVHRINKKN